MQRPALTFALTVFLVLTFFCRGFLLAGIILLAIMASLVILSCILECREMALVMLAAAAAAVLLAQPVLKYRGNGLMAPLGIGEYRVRVTSIQARADGKRRIYGTLDSGARVASVLSSDQPSCYPADLIVIRGDMEMPSCASNPGTFDYRSYLAGKGISRSLRAYDMRLESEGRGIGSYISAVASFAEDLRFSFIDIVTSGMDGDTKALACALLFGDRSLLPDETSRAFTLAGVNHLAAVSGTHFTGFLMLFPYLMRLAGIKNRRLSGVIYILSCVFIGFLTSWTESVTRAAFMNVCSFFGRDSLSSMSLAAIILMISDPYSVVSQGFLMSYAAALALRFVVPGIEDKLVALSMNFIRPSGWKEISSRRTELRLRKIVSVFAATTGCSLIFCLFADSVEIRVGPVIIMINIIATLMVSFICASFMPMAVIMGIWILFSNEAGPAQIALTFMLGVFRSFLRRASDISYSSFGVSTCPQNLITCIVIFMVLLILPKCLVRKLLLRLSCFALCLSLGFSAADHIKYGVAGIVFVDVGQGDCALVMAGGKTALIDGGVVSEGLDTLPYVLDHYNIDKVDYAIMSHWDLDHVGGLLSLFSQGRVERLYSPYTECDEQAEEVLAEALGLSPEECGSFVRDNIRGIRSGDSFVLSDSCRLNVIYPARAASGENEDSAVIELDSCGTKILFTGDIGLETESLLTDSGILSDIDILKVAHHGSRFSTGSDFLSAVKPENAVISVATRNPYGHPAPAALARLDEAGCRIFKTSISGAVIVDIGSDGYKITSFVPVQGIDIG